MRSAGFSVFDVRPGFCLLIFVQDCQNQDFSGRPLALFPQPHYNITTSIFCPAGGNSVDFSPRCGGYEMLLSALISILILSIILVLVLVLVGLVQKENSAFGHAQSSPARCRPI